MPFQSACHCIQIRESDKRVVEADMFGAQALDVIFDIFRIGGDDRAIVVVACLRKLGALIRDARGRKCI